MPLVLASASPRRSELLKRAGYSFAVAPPEIDESPREREDALAYCERMAREKAAAGAEGRAAGTVLGGDTVVIIDGDILGKPRDVEDAHAMLSSLSGRTHHVASAVALRDVGAGVEVSGIEVSEVCFDELSSEVLDGYLAGDEWCDKAGAYAIQGEASRFAHLRSGELDTVIGLPILLVADLSDRLAEMLP